MRFLYGPWLEIEPATLAYRDNNTLTNWATQPGPGSKLFDIGLSNIYIFWYVCLGKGNKVKNKQMGLDQTKKVFHSEGNYQQMKSQQAQWE